MNAQLGSGSLEICDAPSSATASLRQDYLERFQFDPATKFFGDYLNDFDPIISALNQASRTLKLGNSDKAKSDLVSNLRSIQADIRTYQQYLTDALGNTSPNDTQNISDISSVRPNQESAEQLSRLVEFCRKFDPHRDSFSALVGGYSEILNIIADKDSYRHLPKLEIANGIDCAKLDSLFQTINLG